jgi:hypothetical protein
MELDFLVTEVAECKVFAPRTSAQMDRARNMDGIRQVIVPDHRP